MAYVRSANPIWLMVDLVGQILDDNYYIHYLTNDLPYLPQLVYRDNQALVPWTDPIEFYPNGTLPDNIYFDENLVYRLEVRRGPTQNDPLIYEINDYVPGNGGAPDTENTGAQENQISNPQFSQVNFSVVPGGASTPSLEIDTAGTYEIAPDWFLTLAGSGICNITQLILSGDQNLPTAPAPPYALRIATSGSWSSVILYQRFSGNGDIWANTFVSMSLLARSSNGVANPVTLIYSPNTPGTPTTITTTPLNTGTYETIQGIIPLPVSTNTTLNNDAYVDMQIVLPASGSIDISNIQVMGQVEELPIDFSLQPEETIERQIDHLFNYYKPQLTYKQIPSYLIGWDFPLNPSQFFGPTVTPQAVGANKSYYAWDQTIIFQSANSAVTVTQGAPGDIVLTTGTTAQIAMIQYLDQDQVRKLTRQKIATNILAYTNKVGGLKVTVSMYATTASALPSMVSNNSLVATLDANGKPATFNDSWAEVPRELGQDATFIIDESTDLEFTDYMLNGWNWNHIPSSNLLKFFAIVIGTAPMASTDALHIQSVSLCSGDIATRPAPQTFDEVFRQCQYFYEKTYELPTVAGTATSLGQRMLTLATSVDASGLVYNMYAQTFNVLFEQTKRALPNVTFYSTDGTVNSIRIGMVSGNNFLSPDSAAKTNPNNDAISGYVLSGQSSAGLTVSPTALRQLFTFASASFGGLPFTLQSLIFFHYVADARLGIV